MPTAMISGHLDLTEDEFKEHYEPALWRAVRQGCVFVVGDARGADAMTQEFLSQRYRKLSVVVYHMFTAPRHNIGNFPTKGGYTKDDGKDAAMTAESDFDILWVRPSKHSSESGRVSGTEQNQIRRKAKEMSK